MVDRIFGWQRPRYKCYVCMDTGRRIGIARRPLRLTSNPCQGSPGPYETQGSGCFYLRTQDHPDMRSVEFRVMDIIMHPTNPPIYSDTDGT